MNEKNKFLVLKISIPLVIIGGCIGINRFFNAKAEGFSKSPVVVCEDSSSLSQTDNKPLEIVSKKSYGNVVGVSENLGFIGEDEAIVGIGLGSDEFHKKYVKEITKVSDEEFKAQNDIYGSLYKLKLSTLEKKPLNIETKNKLSDILPSVCKLNYAKGNSLYIYDLKNDSSSAAYRTIKDKAVGSEETANWSQDGNCLISYTDNGDLRVYNIKKNSTKEVKVKREDLSISIIPSFYSEDGENIYFIGVRYQRQGLFKVNSSSGKIDVVFVLPYRDTQGNDNSTYSDIFSGKYDLLEGGKKVLFKGMLEGKDGSYIYDTDSKKFYNVVSHTVKSKEGPYGSPMWISPDKTKVVYINLVLENKKEQWNLYAAKINGNSFTSRICLASNIDLAGSFDDCIQWSSDSKKILFFNGKKSLDKNRFVLRDNNEVNVITFK
ncbi:hypothetical protein JMF89_07445 [Clostridiaceae bacterium UIB06]|uniref:WD40 repeat domain-containing protein n=1 Tax=Clostridium thailandense TaxID=2794346 RepID=A0A949TJW4_9CLOT|nr:hypothetical protein [Clostridium thailandense]MBV7273645.1 hypothetical protein [Clostridium thailandense]MCH5137037.1 hypothetical protein [Clostridiaceae bacterium UIB06]